MDSLETLRPTNGWTGAVFNEGNYGENFIASLAEYLDQGDGWVTTTRNSLTWYANELALSARVVERQLTNDEWGQYVNIDVVLVEEIPEEDASYIELLNEMNAQAAGWVAWLNVIDNTISFSMRVAVEKTHWWWQSLAFHAVPLMLVAAEANAAKFAHITGGKIAARKHPQHGPRTEPDAWMSSTLTMLKEPTVSLDLMLTTYDYQVLNDSMSQLFPGQKFVLKVGPKLQLLDDHGAIFAQLQNTWHPIFGLGWQFVSVESDIENRKLFHEEYVNSMDLAGAADRNCYLLYGDRWATIMGGWVLNDTSGFQRQMFFPAQWIETLIRDGRHSIGSITGFMLLMFESVLIGTAYERKLSHLELDVSVDEHNLDFQSSANQIVIQNSKPGRALLLPDVLQPFDGPWDRGDVSLGNELMWHIPKIARICSFGIFNPAGPTVSSLELGNDGQDWTLYFVLRHPFGSHVEELGTFDNSEFDTRISELIIEAFSNAHDGILGSGPDWMSITWDDPTPIFIGLQNFAHNKQDADWIRECQTIIGGGGFPWARISLENDQLPTIEVEHPADEWIGLILEPDFIAGHQHFIRSAWEGSKFFARGEFEEAQAVTNAITSLTMDRINTDFEFRNKQGFRIEYPRVEQPIS